MKGDISKLYTSKDDFFRLEGSVVMKLTPSAAIDACRSAARHGFVVARIEGGIWHAPGFEARLDCIWNGEDPPLGIAEANENNERAAKFIDVERSSHDVFILTTPPLSGWPHKRNN